MFRFQRWRMVGLGLFLMGCDGLGEATAVPVPPLDMAAVELDVGRDAAQHDAVVQDAAQADAALLDMVIPDAALPDAALPDAALPDAAVRDAAVPDAAVERCEALPAACGAVTPAAVAQHHLEVLPGCAFALQRTGDVAAAQALADAIADRADGVRTVDQVLQNLNRVTRPGITAAAADRLRNHDYWWRSEVRS